MTDLSSEIVGVVLKDLNRHSDHRGWLAELFRTDEITPENRPAMAYLSLTHPGISRGPHEHRQQSDLIVFLGHSHFELYLWDNRPESASFKKHERMVLASNRIISVTIPPGVVHGYKNIGDTDGYTINLPNRLYKGRDRIDKIDEIRHEEDPDSKFRIED